MVRVDHFAQFLMEERHRHVKHSDDHRRVCLLGLVVRCPTQDQSNEFQRWSCRKRVRSRFACVHLNCLSVFVFQPIFDQIFLPSFGRISDSTSKSSSSRTSLARPFRTSSESSFSPVLASYALMASVALGSSQSTTAIDSCSPSCIWVSVVHVSVVSNCHTSSSGTSVATTSIPSITHKPPIVISTLLDDAGAERTTVPEPSAVGTIIGGDAGLAFTTGLPEISLVGVSLGRAALRSLRSCGPISIGESICSF